MEVEVNDAEVEICISIVDILDYVGESVRPIKEGYAVFVANHIVCIGFRKQDANCVDVAAFVTQSSHPGLAPHKLDLKISANLAEWVLRCSCKAGTAKCKHLIACLLHIEKYRKLEYLSCTDVTQAWGITKAQKSAPWGAKRIKDLCCVKTQKEIDPFENEACEEILQNSFERILSVSKESAIYKHINGRHMNHPLPYPDRAMQSASSSAGLVDSFCSEDDIKGCLTLKTCEVVVKSFDFCSDSEQAYYADHIQLDVNRTVSIALETQTQNSNAWKIHRSIRITASTCYKLFTYLNNKNPDWNKKIGQYWESKALNIKATKYGKEAEPLAFECYRRMRNPIVKRCGFVVHPEESWIGGSPDGLDPLMNVLLEIKCPGNSTLSLHDILSTPNVIRYVQRCSDGKLMLNPHHMYYCQIQINMWILNCNICDFVIYSVNDDDFQVIEVAYNPEYTTKVVNGLKSLYFNTMLSKVIASKA